MYSGIFLKHLLIYFEREKESARAACRTLGSIPWTWADRDLSWNRESRRLTDWATQAPLYNGILFRLWRNEILTRATTRMNLANVMLSEIRQTRKDKCCVFLFMWGTRNRQIERDRRQISCYQGLGVGVGVGVGGGKEELVLNWWKKFGNGGRWRLHNGVNVLHATGSVHFKSG